jgi:hypothetical protein
VVGAGALVVASLLPEKSAESADQGGDAP